VRCAVAVQEEIGKEGAGRPEGEEMLFGDARTPAFTLLKRLARGLERAALGHFRLCRPDSGTVGQPQ
jgi:hypothetical protein